MNKIFALFSDESRKKIITVFSSPQPQLEGVEEVSISDERYQDFAKHIVDPFNMINNSSRMNPTRNT